MSSKRHHLEQLAIRRTLRLKSSQSIDVTRWLFDKQLDFFNDKSRFKAALCTRRAGKSYLAASMLFKSALTHPNSTSLYVGLTRNSAENIMWPILRELNDRFKLGGVLKESDLTVDMPGNSKIWLVGADMKNFIPRLLGGKYPLGIIDEAQNFRSHIQELVDDVLSPAVLDYNGSICLFGTPGPLATGYYFDVTEKQKHGFSLHKWSLFDNPNLPNAKEFVKDEIKRKGWSADNPTLLRQYFGQWVQDLDSLVYKYRDGRNEFAELPKSNDWHSILGIDYGFNDKTAFAVVSYNPHSPFSFVEYSKGHAEMIPSEIAEETKRLIARFKPVKIVADTGGLGKSITEEMIRRHGLPIHAAQKTDKLTWISLINGDFSQGNLKVHSALENLRNLYKTLVKDDKGLEDPGLPNDECDAVLYAWRESHAYAHTPIDKPDLDERLKREEAKMLQYAEEELLRETNENWWEK